MIKINYPLTKEDKDIFEKEYWDLFSAKQNEYTIALSVLSSKNFLKNYTLKDIILGDIKKLVEIYNKYNRASKAHKTEIDKNILEIAVPGQKECKNILKYDQPNISMFFRSYNHIFNFRACHYCNMDSVHVYSELDAYYDALDFIKNASIEQLKTIKGIGDAYAEKIVKVPQKEKDNWTISNLKGILKTAYENISQNKIEKKDHFTLDHFIPQDECKLLAISLYNFVPSCYVCNSKLKKTFLLCEEKSNLYKYSPTYENFQKDGEIKFSLRLDSSINIFDYNINRISLLKHAFIDINAKENNKALDVFRLKQRYAIHKDKAVRLAYLKERYSEKTIEEIAKILNINSHLIKSDIFNIPSLENESFSKLQKDIVLQLGIE